MFRAAAALSAFLVLAACTGTTPQGEQIRLASDSRAVEGCAFISQISASSNWGGFAAQGLAEDNAMAELRNSAAEAGGDTVLVVSGGTGFGGARKTADVYRCRG